MTAVQVLLAVLMGVGIGCISGTIGIGGGVFLIPLLVFFYGMSQKTAQGTSVATLLLPIGVAAFFEYYKSGHVNVKLAMWVAVGFIAGSWFGGMWAQRLSDVVLRRVFAGVLVVLAAKLVLTKT